MRGLLDRPTEGQVLLEGQSAWELPLTACARLRNATIGFVFQFYHLLPELDAVENVLLPSMIALSRGAFARRWHELRERARELPLALRPRSACATALARPPHC